MKKLFLTFGLITMSGAAFAQGYLFFNAGTIPIVETNAAISPMFGGSGLGGVAGNTFGGSGANVGAYQYALLVSPWTGSVSTDTAVWDGSWSLALATVGANDTVPITSSNSVAPGRVWANTPAGEYAIQMTDWANGTYENIVLVGWSANLGSSWFKVSAELAGIAAVGYSICDGYFGESTIGYLTPNAATPGAEIFKSAADLNGLPIDNPATNPMELYALPVPEPVTMALVGMCGLSLLLFRRRK